MIKEFVILGGGSAYTPGLLQALIAHGSRLGLTRVRLYDTHTEHLELVGRLGSAMARSAGASFTVETAPNLVAALTGADVVLNSTRPGGFAARRIDETLPLSLGIPGQETVGPGGFFFALRSVPEALNLADTMALHAPDALLLNYTNPSNIVTQALVDHGRVRVLGLCDQSDEDLQALAQALGRPQAAYTFRCNGLNHATWYSDIQLDGVALTDLPEHLPIPQDMNEEHQLRFALSLEMARKTPGYWPNSYLPYYQAPEQFVALARTQGPRSDAIVARLPSYYAHFREEADKEHPQLRHHRGTAGFGDLAVTVITALQAKRGATLVLNVENQGTTPLLAPNTVMEARGQLNASGWTRAAAPDLPAGQLPLLHQLESYQHLAAEAARTGVEATILQALTANPLVGNPARAAALWALARKQYGALLPELA
ncbi:MAG: 6-phospho-beta-glucosidase [Rhodoferax sp.]|jgi:6-phospho-beta-glucosidase